MLLEFATLKHIKLMRLKIAFFDFSPIDPTFEYF